jgi:hypothetical protein
VVRRKKKTKRLILIAVVAVVVVILVGVAYVLSQSGVEPIPEGSENITITYSSRTADSITKQSGDVVQAGSGIHFLILNVTIENYGYDSFSTYPLFFHVIADGVTYNYYFSVSEIQNWETTDLLSRKTFQGELVFLLPDSASTFTLDYDAYLNYKIIWNKP